MVYGSNASKSLPPPQEQFSEKSVKISEGRQRLGNVIFWEHSQPPEKSGRSGSSRREEKVEDFLQNLGFSSEAPPVPTPAPAGKDAFVLTKPAPAKKLLREELPTAVAAYGKLIILLRENLQQFVLKKKLDVPLFEKAVSDVVDSLQRNSDALLCLGKLLPPKEYVYSHCANVCVFLAAFALQSGKSHAEAIAAGMAGLFHDVGMTMMPLSILDSAAELSPTEQVLVKRHPILACDLFSAVPGMHSEVFYAALEHHERFDGSGYPAGLSGMEISYMGHLTNIASVFDAISSNRRHRSPLHPHNALAEMFRRRNKQFHPILAESFVRMIGIYPVGTVVELKDGYRAIVSGSVSDAPLRPQITLVMDPKGRAMAPIECAMKKENVADIAKCLSPDGININIGAILGLPEQKGSAPG